MKKILSTVVLIFVLGISNAYAKTTSEWKALGIEALQEGGKIIFLRHAYAPRTEANGNHDKKYNVNDCSTQRDILSEGIKQSKEIGQWVKENNIVIEKVYSSPTCRTYKTAKNAGWEYSIDEVFQNAHDSKEQQTRFEQIRKLVAEWDGKGNLVIVTHFKVINPLFPGTKASSGEMVITDGTLIGNNLQYFKPVGKIKFAYDPLNKI